jgi:3-hydroxyacyl-CoA dehydrogenase
MPPDSRNPVEHVAIVGAGVMGRSIALANLRCGLAVTLNDTNPAALQSAADAIRRQLGPDSPAAAQLRTADDPRDLPTARVVIEAVIENHAAKRRLLAALDRHIPVSALLATNTSSLSVAALAEPLRHPERFCGLHFCHPVADRPLVEVIAAPRTAPATLDRALEYVAALGKRPLRTADVTGFAVNRLLFPYLEAAVELVRAGVDWQAIESAGREFGMPMGPLSQIDDIGIDVILRAAAALHRGDYQVPANSEPLLALYQSGRLGRKAGLGFFAWDSATGDPRDDPRAADVIGPVTSASPGMAAEELTGRLFVPMLCAAAELLERQIVANVDDVRRALSDGLGWNPDRPALLEWGADLPPDQRRVWLARLALDRHAEFLERLLH